MADGYRIIGAGKRAKNTAVTDKRDLDLVLAAAGCLAGLRA